MLSNKSKQKTSLFLSYSDKNTHLHQSPPISQSPPPISQLLHHHKTHHFYHTNNTDTNNASFVTQAIPNITHKNLIFLVLINEMMCVFWQVTNHSLRDHKPTLVLNVAPPPPLSLCLSVCLYNDLIVFNNGTPHSLCQYVYGTTFPHEGPNRAFK